MPYFSSGLFAIIAFFRFSPSLSRYTCLFCLWLSSRCAHTHFAVSLHLLILPASYCATLNPTYAKRTFIFSPYFYSISCYHSNVPYYVLSTLFRNNKQKTKPQCSFIQLYRTLLIRVSWEAGCGSGYVCLSVCHILTTYFKLILHLYYFFWVSTTHNHRLSRSRFLSRLFTHRCSVSLTHTNASNSRLYY